MMGILSWRKKVADQKHPRRTGRKRSIFRATILGFSLLNNRLLPIYNKLNLTVRPSKTIKIKKSINSPLVTLTPTSDFFTTRKCFCYKRKFRRK